MSHIKIWLIFILSLLFVLILIRCSDEVKSCKYDTDCKGDKVCRNSQCVGLYENIDVENIEDIERDISFDIKSDYIDIHEDIIIYEDIVEDVESELGSEVYIEDVNNCNPECEIEGERICKGNGFFECVNISSNGKCLKNVYFGCEEGLECRNGFCGKDECAEGDRLCVDSVSYSICERDVSGFLRYLVKKCEIGTSCQKKICCPNNMVEIEGFCIDRYEAVVSNRPDCSEQIYGQNEDNYPSGFPDNVDLANNPPSVYLFSCSIAGVLPSRFLTQMQAKATCLLSGKRLCKREEFTLACNGGNQNYNYPYGSNYQSEMCNDYALISKNVKPTGNMPRCVSQFGVFDLSGNAEEWVEDPSELNVGYTMGGRVGCCAFFKECTCSTCKSIVMRKPIYTHNYTGFRCCK